MKRLVLISAALLGVSSTAFAQNGLNEVTLMQKIAKAETVTQDAKKNTKPAPWITLGAANLEATNAPTANLFKGLDEAGLLLTVGKGAESNETVNGMEMKKVSFDYVDVFLKDGIVGFWQVKKPINEGGLEKAMQAFEKAYALDNGAANVKKVQEEVTRVYNAYKQVGDNNFTQRNLKPAADAFSRAYDLTKGGIISVTDTTSGYNAGLIYTMMGDYAKGDKYLSSALQDGLVKGGDTYYYLNLCYTNEGKNAEGKQMLLDGIKKFPTNTKLVEGLLSVYANTGEDPNTIIPYVMEAIALDPKNPELYAGLGRVYDKLGNKEKSIESFQKALSLAPEDFGTNFNVGLMLIKVGDDANVILKDKPFTSKQAFEADLAAVNALYANALPPLEKAHQLNPKDPSTVELLKNLYFRLRDVNAEMQANFDKYNEMLKSMQP